MTENHGVAGSIPALGTFVIRAGLIRRSVHAEGVEGEGARAVGGADTVLEETASAEGQTDGGDIADGVGESRSPWESVRVRIRTEVVWKKKRTLAVVPPQASGSPKVNVKPSSNLGRLQT
jgi:hypothetical protein